MYRRDSYYILVIHMLPVLLHTQSNVVWGCTCIEETDIIY